VIRPQVKMEPSWRRLISNVVGEFGMIVLLRQFDHAQDAAAIAADWRGDGYVAFDVGSGNGLLCWTSQWSSPEGARRFVGAYRDVVLKRNGTRERSLRLDVRVIDCRVDLTLHVPACGSGNRRRGRQERNEDCHGHQRTGALRQDRRVGGHGRGLVARAGPDGPRGVIFMPHYLQFGNKVAGRDWSARN